MLSVVVTIIDGGDALDRCLRALEAQEGSSSRVQVLVPYDDSVPGIAAFAKRYTEFTFLDLGTLHTAHAKYEPAGQHELVERRRSAGLGASRGTVIALLEDRVVPAPDWVSTVIRLHRELPHAVIGGAIRNGGARLVNWADYLTDFAPFLPPFKCGPRNRVSDANSCYKAEVLHRTAHMWRSRHYEPSVQAELLRQGETLFLSEELVVTHIRDGVNLRTLLRERVAWGRLYGKYRGSRLGTRQRILHAVRSILLPPPLLLRLVRDQFSKRGVLFRLVLASPLILSVSCAWCVGEAIGVLLAGANAIDA